MALIARSAENALISLFHQHQGDLKRFLTNKLSNSQDAEDVLQDLYIKLAELEDKVIDKISDPKQYLFRCAHNLAIDHIRKQSRLNNYHADVTVEEAEPQTSVISPDRILEGKQQAELLRAALAQMPAKRREIFLLFKFRNLTQAQIAEELDLSLDAVEKHIVRALKDCRDYLKRGNA